MKHFCMLGTFLLILSLLSAADPSVIGEAVSRLPLQRMLPVHAALGPLADVVTDESGVARVLSMALHEQYGIDWYEKYIHPSARIVMSSLYDRFFSGILPVDSFIMREPEFSGALCAVAAEFAGADGNQWHVVFSLERATESTLGWWFLGLGTVRKLTGTESAVFR